MLIFKEGTLKEICLHARTEYPAECCGMMLGKRMGEVRIVYRVVRAENQSDADKTTHFLMDPFEIAKAEWSAEREQFEIIGFYHSHPDYKATASETDVLHMIEGYFYPIVSARNGEYMQVRSYEKAMQIDIEAREEKIMSS